MKTFTFTFIEEGHGSIAVVTAETEEDCKEKYFMKYPERKEHPGLVIKEGDHNYGFSLEPK
jgi:hypothetical protein